MGRAQDVTGLPADLIARQSRQCDTDNATATTAVAPALPAIATLSSADATMAVPAAVLGRATDMAGEPILSREGEGGHCCGHRTPAEHGGQQHRDPERAASRSAESASHFRPITRIIAMTP
jgi:hypothetical protein